VRYSDQNSDLLKYKALKAALQGISNFFKKEYCIQTIKCQK